VKIFLRSVSVSDGQGSQARFLAHLASLGMHEVTADADDADIVLLTDAPNGLALARFLLADPFVQRYEEKLFLHSEEPKPFRVWPGAYTSMPRSGLDRQTVAPIAYPCWAGALNRVVLERSKEAVQPRDPDLLYSFQGRISHPVRKAMMRVDHPPDALMQDTSKTYHHTGSDSGDKSDFQQTYVDLAMRSRFALCPVGWATSSIRLYEMMALGVAPVVIADRWNPPTGPDWSRFALFVRETDIRQLPGILRDAESEWQERGNEARAAWDEYFCEEKQFDTLVEALRVLEPEAKAGREVTRARWPISLPAMMIWALGAKLG
jgi:Exostosin family